MERKDVYMNAIEQIELELRRKLERIEDMFDCLDEFKSKLKEIEEE